MFNEITKIFLQHGFLVTKTQAAKILGVTNARISQMIKEGKITPINVLTIEMIKFSDLKNGYSSRSDTRENLRFSVLRYLKRAKMVPIARY